LDFSRAVDDEELVSRVGQRIGDHAGKPAAVGGLAQHDQAAVRGEVAGILLRSERVVLDW
jgi:hypothetical protein